MNNPFSDLASEQATLWTYAPGSRCPSHEFVDGRHDVRQFGLCDTTVAINIVKLKCPVEFVIRRPSQQLR